MKIHKNTPKHMKTHQNAQKQIKTEDWRRKIEKEEAKSEAKNENVKWQTTTQREWIATTKF